MKDKHKIDGHKLHLHPKRVVEWLQRPQLTYPIYVEVSPVGACNHRCRFCAVDYIGYQNRRIEADLMITRLQEMRQLGVRSVMFAGEGEPLLHPQLAQVINACGDVNLDVGITTNGTAMTRKFIDKCGHNVKWIKVSVNGGSTSYDRIHYCNENHYELVWKNLEYAISKNPRPTVGIQCVALPDNSQDLIELTTRAREYKLDYIVIKPYSQHKMSNTKRYRPIKYSESSEGEAMSDIFDLCEELATDEFEVIVRRESMNTWDKRERPYTTCHSTPYFWAYIMATGDVYGCSAYLLDPRFNYGNIKDNTFEEIWQGEKRQESMDYVKNELCIDECRRNCRMDKVNRYLWELKNPNEHDSFI